MSFNDETATTTEETVDQQPGESEAASGEALDAGAGEAQGEQVEVDDELVVTFEGEEPQGEPEEEKKAPQWVKELRKANREQQREIKRLQKELESSKQPIQKAEDEEVGPRPQPIDFDFDDDKFADALLDWNDRKRKAEEKEKAKKERAEQEEKAWNAKVENYGVLKQSIGAPDYDEAEAEVMQALNQTQQGIILSKAKDPAKLVYAIGKSPAKLKELAETTDLIDFAYAIRDLEGKVSISKRTPPPPEPKGPSASGSGSSVDDVLEKLREEAQKTGDYTKIREYKSKLNKKD